MKRVRAIDQSAFSRVKHEMQQTVTVAELILFLATYSFGLVITLWLIM